jgi:Flp pilus assembly pilin Flp
MPNSRIARLAARMDCAAQDEDGQGLVEYALMIMLVSIAAITALTLLGSSISDLLDLVGAGFP